MPSIDSRAQAQGLTRRAFLRQLLVTAGSVSAASWLTGCQSDAMASSRSSGVTLPAIDTPGADPVSPRISPFLNMGPLLPPDANGLQLPVGFSSRVVAVFNQPPIPGQAFRWHSDPDGGGVFRTDDGGWIYVSNSEARDATTLFGQIPPGTPLSQLASRDSLAALSPVTQVVSGLLPLSLVLPFGGGVSALRFDREGRLVDAYPVQRNTTTNCSGGVTPWGTWINGEEIADGYMFECSPLRDGGAPIRLDRFGRKAHEMAAIDENGRAIYHTEDLTDQDRFYRTVFAAADWPSGERPNWAKGKLQVLAVPGGLAAARQGPTPIVWLDAIDDGRPQNQVYLPESTPFAGNEGVWFLDGIVFFTTKRDDTIWALDTQAQVIEAIYQPGDQIPGSPVDPREPSLSGIDNICMTLDGEMIVVEDGGDMRAMVRLPDGVTIPLLRLPGDPAQTEVTGPAFSPDGRRLYVANQRALPGGQAGPLPFGSAGTVYEILMPFSVRVNPPLAGSMPS